MEKENSRFGKGIGTLAVIAASIVGIFYVGMSDDTGKTIVAVPVNIPN
jgi:hypothetical protein